MKSLNLLILIICVITVISCGHSSEEAEKYYPVSYELSGNNDTVNLKDNNGRQGLWVPTLLNNLKDTTYYRNDTIFDK